MKSCLNQKFCLKRTCSNRKTTLLKFSVIFFDILESPNDTKPKSAVAVDANKRFRKQSWRSLSFEEGSAQLAQSPPPSTNPWKILPSPEQPTALHNIQQVSFFKL